MRTTVLAAWLVLVAVATAGAQEVQRPQTASRPGGRSVRQGASSAPPPSVNPAPPKAPPAPPPPATKSLPPVARPGLPQPGTSPFDAGPWTYAPRYRPSQRPWPPYSWGSGWVGYGAPYEVLPSAPPPAEPRGSAEDQLSRSGVLELEIEPGSADVYVDGFYVGTAEDVALNGLVLRAGRHWVDVRAPGYDTLTVQVTIVAGQYSRYRRELALTSGSVSSAVAPAPGPQTIYVIPGCFAGNRPPVESALPRGCSIANLRVSQP